MTIKKYSLVFVLAFGLGSLASCYYDVESELYPDSANCTNTDYTYAGRIQGIIANNCLTGCHSGATPSAGLNLEGYDALNAIALNGALMSSLNGTDGFSIMPSGSNGLAACDIDAVQQWVNGGALNN